MRFCFGKSPYAYVNVAEVAVGFVRLDQEPISLRSASVSGRSIDLNW
ncbi:MAG: hypothetical protein IPL27_16010 [Lewinellaceae bacterium]|nr:hypothetical protein [Lewinellaceae bacterium]